MQKLEQSIFKTNKHQSSENQYKIYQKIGTEKCNPPKLVWHFYELQNNYHNFYNKKVSCFGYKILRNKITFKKKLFP
jgi:hypothetical protein